VKCSSLFGALCLALSASSPAVAGTKPWSLDDILSVRTVTDPQVSPDGRWVAHVVQELKADGSDYQSDVWLAETASGNARRLTASPADDLSPSWSNDGRTIAFLSDRPRPDRKDDAGEEGKRQIWLIAPDGGEATLLSNAPGGVSGFQWSRDGRAIAYLSRDAKTDEQKRREKDRDDAWTPTSRYAWNRLWLFDVASRKSTQLTSGDLHVTDFSIAPDGKRIVIAAQPTPRLGDRSGSDLYLVATTGGTSGKPIPLVQRKGVDESPAFSNDGRWIAFVSQDARSTEVFASSYVCIVPTAGGRSVNITPDFDQEIGGAGTDRLVWMHGDDGIAFSATARTQVRLYRASPDERPVERLLPDGAVDGSPSFSADGDQLAWLREDSTHPRDVWTWKLSHGEPHRLTDHNPQVRDLLEFEKQVISWPGADGQDMEGLLISPVGPRAGTRTGTRAPLVLNIHGGPAGTHLQSFTPASRTYPWSLFAQEGWAILLPNPRGSSGYGEAFRRANVRDWGGKDREDIMGGVDALVKLGLVDDKRMAVCGWSYGGYMTAAIVTSTDRFRAAVMGAGMPDLTALATVCDIPEAMQSYMHAWPWEDSAVYVEHSPLYRAGNVKTPTALVQGAVDDRVPPSQAWAFYNALQRVGVPTDLLVLPRQGHGPREPRLQRSVMQYHHDWLTRYTLAAPTGLQKPRAKPMSNTKVTPKEAK